MGSEDVSLIAEISWKDVKSNVSMKKKVRRTTVSVRAHGQDRPCREG